MEAENDTVAVVDASTPADVKVEKETMIALVSRNGQKFQVPKAAAVLSGFIKDTLDIDDEDEEPENYQSVHVLRVNGDCLQKVVDFLVHYHQDPIPEISQPLVGNSLHEIVTLPWYQTYISDQNLSRSMRFQLISAANYMAIPPLVDLCCLHVTFQLKGRSAEEIRIYLSLPQMTAEEEARAREEHPWVFENND